MLRFTNVPLESTPAYGHRYATAGLPGHRAICFSARWLPAGVLDRSQLGSTVHLSGILLPANIRRLCRLSSLLCSPILQDWSRLSVFTSSAGQSLTSKRSALVGCTPSLSSRALGSRKRYSFTATTWLLVGTLRMDLLDGLPARGRTAGFNLHTVS